jgi:hypothetical protein
VHEPSAYWADFARRFADIGIEAKLIGALAALQYRAQPRATTDVDFLARTLDGLVEAMEADGYECKTMAEPGAAPFVVFIRGKGHRVDVLLAETEYQHTALDRATGPAITAEDVIVHKLIAWRPRDQDDIAQILAAGLALDTAYIEQWAEAWGVVERWDEAKLSCGG